MTKKKTSANQLELSFEEGKQVSVEASVDIKPSKAATKIKKSEQKSEVEVPTKKRASQTRIAATAESMAGKQRDISISEFFAKNRHLLGFDNPRRALLTAVKEAVDNSLDACEEAQIMPKLTVTIKSLKDDKFTLTVRDNGPGIVKKQVPNIFARLLYGSKFHSLKMSRGQQGIGISAAGMYGLLTTGEPVQIVSRTSPNKPAYHCHVQIDTSINRPQVMKDEDCEFDLPTGTSVTITLVGKYLKGKQSVDEYIAQTAIANPHAEIIYNSPDGETYEYKQTTEEPPFLPVEIKPHPYGVELGLLYKMIKDSSYKSISEFLRNEFSRVSQKVAEEICNNAKIDVDAQPARFTLKKAEVLHKAINETKIKAPSTNCIGPIGEEKLKEGLARVVDADFYEAVSRSPSVYRGNPFLVEAAIAYGIKSGSDAGGEGQESDKEPLMRVMRIANRVPLLYQQSSCAIYKAVLDINWRNYSLSQSRGALPQGPLVLMVHFASVWVPFTSESKEAIAHYPEIIREIQLAIQECGRKLGVYLRRQKRIKREMAKRHYIETYLPYIGEALQDILSLKDNEVKAILVNLEDVLEKTRKI